MQPARLGAAVWSVLLSALLGILVLAPPSRAQAVLETPQQTNDRIRSLSTVASRVARDYIIGSGDVVNVDVFDVPELSRDVRVSQTGSVGLPLLPVRLQVAGLTEIQAQQKIAEILEANGLVSHPQVTVSVKERKSKPITVVGAVVHPMVFQAERPVTLLEVLAEAGGIANDAGDTVIVTRHEPESAEDPAEPPAIGPEDPAATGSQPSFPKEKPASSGSSPAAATSAPGTISPALADAPAKPAASGGAAAAQTGPPVRTNIITVNLNNLLEEGDTQHNLPLQAGDVVTVPHAGIVYVLGAVGKPGGYVVSNDRTQLSTLKVLSLAGGLSRAAKSANAVIIRKDNQGQQHEVPVDLQKVMQRRVEDVQLQPSDILYVPTSGGKQALFKAAELGVAVGSAAAIFRIANR